MPSRHISPQSFDEILSELGDDPAIPGPHGIRKTTSPKSHPKMELAAQIPNLGELKKMALLVGLGIGLVVLGLVLSSNFEPMKSSPEPPPQVNQKELAKLEEELGLLREEILIIEDELYDSIELIEVSVHSLLNNKISAHPKPKVPVIPFESELRLWRYLGMSQSGSSEQAFFQNERATIMIEKGAPLLGDWRLSHINKEAAILTHPQGKTITLRSSKAQ